MLGSPLKFNSIAHDAEMCLYSSNIKIINPALPCRFQHKGLLSSLRDVFELCATKACTAEEMLQNEVQQERNWKYFSDLSARHKVVKVM